MDAPITSKMDAIPFEIWRAIFTSIFSAPTAISHPESLFEWSPLNARLHIFRNLALVCRAWHAIARDVFFEDLQAETEQSLHGIVNTCTKNRQLAQAITQLKLSFWEFRCSASSPRRPRLPKQDVERIEEEGAPTPPVASQADHDKLRSYRPSVTMQSTHWLRWHGLSKSLLAFASSLSAISINFTGDYKTAERRSYHALFPEPDLRVESILNGLLACSNIRHLDLVDPSPLSEFGEALASWTRLKELSITLTPTFPQIATELSDMSFLPPPGLESFRFHDYSNGKTPWPLSADLARCTNLTNLDLGVTTFANDVTVMAVSFLLQSYQHTLVSLRLEILQNDANSHLPKKDFSTIFSTFETPIQFSVLENLALPGSNCASDMFSLFSANRLQTVMVRALDHRQFLTPEHWKVVLAKPIFAHLKKLTISKMAAEAQNTLQAACDDFGVALEVTSTRD